jgi:hypothetical protein
MYTTDLSYVPGSLIKRKKTLKDKTRAYVTSLSGKTFGQMLSSGSKAPKSFFASPKVSKKASKRKAKKKQRK